LQPNNLNLSSFNWTQIANLDINRHILWRGCIFLLVSALALVELALTDENKIGDANAENGVLKVVTFSFIGVRMLAFLINVFDALKEILVSKHKKDKGDNNRLRGDSKKGNKGDNKSIINQ